MHAFEIHQFPCLSDNYGFLLHEPQSGETACIDTPDACEILDQAERKGWQITQIWNTHWHPDHAGGNLKIKEMTQCQIIGPAGEVDRIPGMDRQVGQGDWVSLGILQAEVFDVPGHTTGHIAYALPAIKTAFVGDTLFALGCGRLFEGTPAQMWDSLLKLRNLSEDTQIYCAHEYTAANAKFALSIDPGNAALQSYAKKIFDRREQNLPTVPTVMGLEMEANPFLRADNPDLQAAMGYAGDSVATFAEIRRRKDSF